jgi:hypothetical protein
MTQTGETQCITAALHGRYTPEERPRAVVWTTVRQQSLQHCGKTTRFLASGASPD